jgi:hypothetical protein
MGRVGTHSRFEYPDNIENPQGVGCDIHFFRGEYVDCFVLAHGRLAAVIT